MEDCCRDSKTRARCRGAARSRALDLRWSAAVEVCLKRMSIFVYEVAAAGRRCRVELRGRPAGLQLCFLLPGPPPTSHSKRTLDINYAH
jgi:hypothetical protein